MGGERGGTGGTAAKECGVSFRGDESYLKLNSGDSCPTLQIY